MKFHIALFVLAALAWSPASFTPAHISSEASEEFTSFNGTSKYELSGETDDNANALVGYEINGNENDETTSTAKPPTNVLTCSEKDAKIEALEAEVRELKAMLVSYEKIPTSGDLELLFTEAFGGESFNDNSPIPMLRSLITSQNDAVVYSESSATPPSPTTDWKQKFFAEIEKLEKSKNQCVADLDALRALLTSYEQKCKEEAKECDKKKEVIEALQKDIDKFAGKYGACKNLRAQAKARIATCDAGLKFYETRCVNSRLPGLSAQQCEEARLKCDGEDLPRNINSALKTWESKSESKRELNRNFYEATLNFSTILDREHDKFKEVIKGTDPYIITN